MASPSVSGGCQHVVKQSDLTKIEITCQVKSKEIIVQRIGRKFQESDLVLNLEASVWIVDLFNGQSGLRQQGRELGAGFPKVRG